MADLKLDGRSGHPPAGPTGGAIPGWRRTTVVGENPAAQHGSDANPDDTGSSGEPPRWFRSPDPAKFLAPPSSVPPFVAAGCDSHRRWNGQPPPVPPVS